jgi:hypothetical protein
VIYPLEVRINQGEGGNYVTVMGYDPGAKAIVEIEVEGQIRQMKRWVPTDSEERVAEEIAAAFARHDWVAPRWRGGKNAAA